MTKNKFILGFLAVASLFVAESAKAECDGFYLAARGGMAKIEVDDSRGGVDNSYSDYVVDKKRFMASGALGYRYKHVRGELEYVWRKKNDETVAGFTTGEFKSQSYMFVLYYDFFPYYWFTPFVNAGVGYTQNRLSFYNSTVDVKHSIKDDSFTWSLGAGISAKITNRWNVDLGYRYYDMGDGLAVYNGKTDVTDHEVYLGLRYVL
jgi:opacity protein-like surface antigen